MIDIRTEKVISLPEAAQRLPSVNGKHVHPSSVWRWCRFGYHGVCIEYIRIGFKICTTEEALNRFVNELAQADETVKPKSLKPKTLTRSERQRESDISKAEQELAALGI